MAVSTPPRHRSAAMRPLPFRPTRACVPNKPSEPYWPRISGAPAVREAKPRLRPQGVSSTKEASKAQPPALAARKRMWCALQNSKHVDFYEHAHRGRQTPEEDWMPMVRAVQLLQSLEAAPTLFAFTSLLRFHVTTSPTYAECDRHFSISIIWRSPERRFHLAFCSLAAGWLDDRAPERICDEASFGPEILPFLQRLDDSAKRG